MLAIRRLMNNRRRILVLTLSFGSGHVRAARTVAESIRRRAPGADVRVVDALAQCRALFRAGYAWPYWAMVRYAPTLWDRFFAARVARKDQNTAPEWAFRWGCAKVFEMIAQFDPETIVATEVAACEMAAMAKRARLTRALIVSVITDYEAEPVWIKSEVDCYAVADESVHEQLCGWGAPVEKIVTCGIPIAESFSARQKDNGSATRSRYHIKDDAPLVLLMGGGMGPTRMDRVANHLSASGEAIHIIAITGHDARVRRRLARVKVAPPVSLRVLGWTDDVAALMRAATVLVTKPGGLTTTEAAHCALPIVAFDAIPGPEERNAAKLVEAGACLMTSGARATAAAVLTLLRDTRLRQEMAACAEGLARRDAAAEVARLALGEDLREHKAVGQVAVSAWGERLEGVA